MATSPNYGWAEPDNSSLVKNGAQDIRALGDAIDTSLWNVGFGQAGKNKIINGDFGIWQRGTSFSAAPNNSTFSADRFFTNRNGTGATVTVSQQSFTAGAAPVAGYESQYFYRFAQSVAGTGGTYCIAISQKIEDVRNFAGQTFTVSFWAKADAARTLTLEPGQNFGAGGSSDVYLTSQAVTLTTSWARYSMTFACPSISGKTLGAGSFLMLNFLTAVNTVQTIDMWGIQAEYGSKATPFTTATETIQGELAACQRYYWQTAWNTSAATTIMVGGIGTSSTNVAQAYCAHPVTMRTIPSAALTGTANMFFYNGAGGGSTFAISAIAAQSSTTIAATLNFTSSGTTANVIYNLLAATAGNGFISFNSEL